MLMFSAYRSTYIEKRKSMEKVQKDGKVPLTADSLSKVNIIVNKVNPGRKTFAETINE